MTLVLIRKELLARSPETLPTMLNYNTHAGKGSRFNTPPTFGIYFIGLVTKWIEAQGALAAMAETNAAKAKVLYDAIDGIDLYQGTVQPESRSHMNVTFKLTDESPPRPRPAGCTASRATAAWAGSGPRSTTPCR